MKIMSVDYGDARTGIAMSDINGILASSYCVINESYAPKLADRIAEIAKKEKSGSDAKNADISVTCSQNSVMQKLIMRTRGLPPLLHTIFCPPIMSEARNVRIPWMLYRQWLFFRIILTGKTTGNFSD